MRSNISNYSLKNVIINTLGPNKKQLLFFMIIIYIFCIILLVMDKDKDITFLYCKVLNMQKNIIIYYYILLYIMTYKLQLLKKLIDEHFEKINKLTNKPLNYEFNKINKELFLNNTAQDARQAMEKLLDEIIHVSYDKFIEQIKNNLDKDPVIAQKLVNRPIFFYFDDSHVIYDKSNYWIYTYIKQYLNKKNIQTELINNNNYNELQKNDIVLFVDDCIYSGHQITNTILQLYHKIRIQKINEEIKLLLFVPYISEEGFDSIYRLFENRIPKLNISEHIKIKKIINILKKDELNSIFKYYSRHTELNKYLIYFDHKVADYLSTYPYIFNGLVPNQDNKEITDEILKLKSTYFDNDYDKLYKLEKEYEEEQNENLKKELEENLKKKIKENEDGYNNFEKIKNEKIEELQKKLVIFPLLTNCDHITKFIDFEYSVCPIPPYKKEYSDFLKQMHEVNKTKK